MKHMSTMFKKNREQNLQSKSLILQEHVKIFLVGSEMNLLTNLQEITNT